MELLGKFIPTKILQMRCCQNKTSFSWSYRDSSKRSLENNVISRRGKRKIHTLEMTGHVQMAKNDLEAQRNPRYRIAHGWKIEYGSFNLKALKFLMHFREPGSSLYFYFYTYSYYFSRFLIYLFLSFFLFLNFFLFLSHKNFICSPLNSKIASYLPPPHA
jgi:cellulose synthase/poly-beta-1,6-N-acetylglucosamine synthase-like glycosyltransferase